MGRYQRLAPCFFGVELLYGKIDLRLDHRFSCFLLLEHTSDADFIREQATQLLLAGPDGIDIYGAYAPRWREEFDRWQNLNWNAVDAENPVVSHDTFESFVESLRTVISVRPLVIYDVYLIYDDAALYQRVLERLKRGRPLAFN